MLNDYFGPIGFAAGAVMMFVGWLGFVASTISQRWIAKIGGAAICFLGVIAGIFIMLHSYIPW